MVVMVNVLSAIYIKGFSKIRLSLPKLKMSSMSLLLKCENIFLIEMFSEHEGKSEKVC